MTANGGDGWSDRDRRLEGSLRTSLSKPLTYHAGGVRSVTCLLPERKLDLCFRLMRVLTDYYRMPHLFPAWATGLAKREALGSTGINHGFGLLHQFQDDSMVELINPPTDWWLVLFPGGIEWGAFDGKPVFGMIGHVFPPNHRKTPGLTMRTWELVSRVGQSMDADAWSRLAKLDRLTAAQLVNRATQLAIRSTCYA